MTAHQKHTKLARPKMGQWGRNEFAIIGTTCDTIASWVTAVADLLSDRVKLGYIDASHDHEAPGMTFHQQATQFESYLSLDVQAYDNMYKRRLLYNDLDLIMINGNHFTAEKQIVFIDERKKESLSKKLDRLTDVDLIILKEENLEVYDFLDEVTSEDTPIIHYADMQAVADHLISSWKTDDVVKGLILAGGKSQRMGHDKTLINYHGTNQVDHLSGIMAPFCQDVFVSLRSDQDNVFQPIAIEDQYLDLGPFGGMLSAFRSDPNAAWLVIASDLPFVNEQVISTLMNERDRSKMATCFIRPDAEFPDPLCTIWEPKSYLSLLEFMALGYSCPRKVLINNDVKEIPLEDATILMNVNDQAELEKAKQLIQE